MLIKDAQSNAFVLTAAPYHQAMGAFDDWRIQAGIVMINGAASPSTVSVCDAVLLYIDYLFFEGESLDTGNTLLAAFQQLRPNMLGPSGVVRVEAALEEWRAAAPSVSRFPLPWLACVAIVGAMCAKRRYDMALATLLAFDTYLKPGEMLALRKSQVIPPNGL